MIDSHFIIMHNNDARKFYFKLYNLHNNSKYEEKRGLSMFFSHKGSNESWVNQIHKFSFHLLKIGHFRPS